MKTILAAALLLSSFAAHAEVKPVGTFVPQACSMNPDPNEARPDIIAIDKVCVGQLAGMDQAAIQIFVNDGSEEIYAINVKDTGVLRMGPNPASFSGVNVDSSTVTVKGQIITVMGIRKSVQVKLKTSRNLKFEGGVEQVWVTQ
jgi:hypothetical protein